LISEAARFFGFFLPMLLVAVAGTGPVKNLW
jgi:hypothetical protein